MKPDYLLDLGHQLDAAAGRLARGPRPRRTGRAALPAALLGAAAASVVAIVLTAPSGGGDEREAAVPPPPAARAEPGVLVAEPVDPPVEVGERGARGRIVLRTPIPGWVTYEGLYFTDGDGHPCLEVGDRRTIRGYPVEDGGSCLGTDLERFGQPLSYSASWSANHPVVVSGFARPDVATLRVGRPGAERSVPLGEERAWFVALVDRPDGVVSLVARMRDGTRRAMRLDMPANPVDPPSVRPGAP